MPRRSFLLLALLCAAGPACAVDVKPSETEMFQAAARGFGDVRVEARFYSDGEKRSSWTTFEAEDAEHARVSASKRLADLVGFGDAKSVAGDGLPGTTLKLTGAGWWMLGIDGTRYHEIYAPTRQGLERLGKQCGASSWKPVPEKAYPRWLDCFDNAGPGVWVGGGGDQYVLPSDFEWLRDRRLSMCTLSPTESRLVGPGVVDTTIFDWHTAMAAKYDLPYRVLFFPASHEWLWNRVPLPYVYPEQGRTISAPWLQYQTNTCASAYEPVPAVDPYMLDLRRRLAEHLRSDPNYVGMHGCTEIPEAGVDLLAAAANTPGIKQLYHGYLGTELGMDLATVGLLHKGDGAHYRSWDDVQVPRPSDFVGWNPNTCLDLRGVWQMHEDTERVGETGSWFDPGKAPTDWVEGDCNDPMILVYTPRRQPDKEKQPDFWMRRTVLVPASRMSDMKYLHIARDVHHGNHTPLFGVWLNGSKLTTISEERGDFDQCFAVGDALREGENQIVLNTHGTPVPGYCFLGPVPLRRYPQMTEPENRLWFDAVNFDAWLRVGKIEAQLRATRAADPDRPLKMMATINLLDMTTPLCEKYGAYQHDTGGAGGYWCPMTGARLARTHGLPWSCEQGGPPRTSDDLQAAITRYIMYGNDAVDMVFGVGHYRDKPDVAAWIDDNVELLHCFGKMQLPTPPIGVLRSTRATRLGFDEPWNWDIARGALQAVGRNFAYLEVPDILDGAIDQFRVVIDDGTVLLTEEEVEGIRRYVRRGGIFVAQHHTGRHTPAKADAWPLARAYGLTVTPKLMTAENYHRWPLGKIHFAKEQDLLPSLRGKELEGSGIAIDYLGKEHTGAVGLSAQPEGSVRPIATWEDGTMAVAEARTGRGRFILMGTPFYLRMRDVSGVWINDAQRNAWLDEFLVALGVPRDSWTGTGEVWAEIWRSKNGVYDLYPVARMATQGEEMKSVSIKLRRASPVTDITEISAPGHPRVSVACKDGALALPATVYSHMQSRVYVAPRSDIERSALNWFRNQSRAWRALPPLPAVRKPREVSVPDDLLPLANDWNLRADGQSDRKASMGAFGTLGLPENTVAAFEKTVPLPNAWKGRRVELVFNCEHWFWGILPQGRLFINGTEAPIKQPITPAAAPGFSIDVTDAAAGSLTIHLDVDGASKSMMRKEQNGLSKPHGVTGLFYLQATAPTVKADPLAGPWQAASSFNRLLPVKSGKKAKCVYLETRFRLPQTWPARRLHLESPEHLGFLVVNSQVLQTPAWMRRLDISGLVHRDGRENVLRWVPSARDVADWSHPYNGVVPELNLVWTE